MFDGQLTVIWLGEVLSSSFTAEIGSVLLWIYVIPVLPFMITYLMNSRRFDCLD
uniref:Uncharacterized protein n=1 Tax=Arundo donax TaxID=35708 RepID=A0A0A9F3Z4_ARUDO